MEPYPPPRNYGAATTKIKSLMCPSASTGPIQDNSFGHVGASSGGVIMGTHVWNEVTPPEQVEQVRTGFWLDDYEGAERYLPFGRVHYAGCAGTGRGTSSYFNRWEGVFTNRSENAIATIPDGSSNTLMFGESCGEFQPTGTRAGDNKWELNWFGVGAISTVRGLGGVRPAPYNDRPARGRYAVVLTFSSEHTNIVQFCFCDGSVRALRIGATNDGPPASRDMVNDWVILQQLAGIRDGMANDTSSLTN
jgi:hypothetical protein